MIDVKFITDILWKKEEEDLSHWSEQNASD
jgi:hypothetical protein